ncbi:unnamed protein product [Adineta steineri]|uniref:Uncharacterized protein n=1 Tax=Adineta steineri TaxID=433720 RepID=A0A819FSH4_9BILA|nr:unnamed protein product [Adineta steineri]CAF3870412.1 unnamed protein product [Adineta steineri]
MMAFAVRRIVSTMSLRTTGVLLTSLSRTPVHVIRPLSLSSMHNNLPNMEQMMKDLSKNPKAMALFQAIQKDPKIMHVVQDLITVMTKKGYIDLKNPTKQPSLAMLTDSEVRTKLFELMKLLAAAGLFNTKAGANPMDAFTNVMGLLMPPSSKDKKGDRLDESKQSSLPKYDYTYDATKKDQSNENTTQAWTDKLKKMFK